MPPRAARQLYRRALSGEEAARYRPQHPKPHLPFIKFPVSHSLSFSLSHCLSPPRASVASAIIHRRLGAFLYPSTHTHSILRASRNIRGRCSFRKEALDSLVTGQREKERQVTETRVVAWQQPFSMSSPNSSDRVKLSLSDLVAQTSTPPKLLNKPSSLNCDSRSKQVGRENDRDGTHE